MPGAPASTQTRTASQTDGTWPPREFRTVATLLTLTDRWIIGYGSSPEPSGSRRRRVFLDGIRDFIRPAVDLRSIAPLQHDAQQRLGARIADEQPTVTDEARFHRCDQAGDLG